MPKMSGSDYWMHLHAELEADGWSLQLSGRAGEWRAFYGNQAHIPRSTKGSSPQEAVERAYKLIKEGN